MKKPRPQRYNDLEEAVAEAIIIDQDYSCSSPPSLERSLQKLTSSSSSLSSDDISAEEGEDEDPPPSPKGTGSAEKDDKIQKNDGIFSAAGKRMKINDPFGNLKTKRRLLLEEAEATNNNETTTRRSQQ